MKEMIKNKKNILEFCLTMLTLCFATALNESNLLIYDKRSYSVLIAVFQMS